VCECVCVCVRVFVCVCVCLCQEVPRECCVVLAVGARGLAFMYIHVYTYIYIYMCIYATRYLYTCICRHTYICMCTYTYIYIHTYIYICTYARRYLASALWPWQWVHECWNSRHKDADVAAIQRSIDSALQPARRVRGGTAAGRHSHDSARNLICFITWLWSWLLRNFRLYSTTRTACSWCHCCRSKFSKVSSQVNLLYEINLELTLESF